MRTKEQISAEMDAVQASLPELSRLTSTSQVSFYKLLKNMMALLTMAQEQRQDQLMTELTTAQEEAQIGSLAWYVKTILAFQFGDAVSVYDGYRVGYPTIDPTKQIIKQAAVTEGKDGRLLVKVAKAGPPPQYAALSPEELTALKEYIRNVKYAGVAVDVISLPPDELRLEVFIEYDRQIIASDGRLLSNPARYPVLEGIENYVRSLPFNSELTWSALSNFVMKTPGILDFQISRSFIRPAGATAYTEFYREVVSRAGYLTRGNDSLYYYV